jgi:hypothetical protein
MTPSVQLLLPLLLAAVAAEAFLLAPPPASTHLLRPARAGAGAGAAPTNLLLSAPSCSRRVVAPLGAGADGEDSSAPKPRRTRKRRKEGVDVANMFSTEEDQQAWEGRGPSSQELSSKGVNMEALEADIAKYRRQKSQSTEVAKPDDEGGRLGIKVGFGSSFRAHLLWCCVVLCCVDSHCGSCIYEGGD